MTWWRWLTGRALLEARLDAELRFHFERLVADHMAQGMNEKQARRTARLQFGGMEQVKEACRDATGTRWVETFAQDVKFAVRQLRANRAFTAVAILALALGIGANTAVFTVVNSVLLRPLPFAQPDRLFLISHEPLDIPFPFGPSLTEGDYLAFQQQDRLFERIATFSVDPTNLTGPGEPIRAPRAAVTGDFFTVLRAAPAIGRTFTTESANVALIGDALWRSRFGADPNILKKSITLDGVSHAVIGVMPAGFDFPGKAEVWTPTIVRANPHNARLRPTMGRLRPGATRQQAQAELTALASHFDSAGRDKKARFDTRILPLKELLVGDIREPLLIFAGAVGFVLLIACANVAGLLLIRAASRQREVAVRAALGAGRWRLIRQFLTESILISVCGGAAGMLLALWLAPALVALAPAGAIPGASKIHPDVWVLAFACGVSLLTGVLFGLAPAVQVTRRALRESLNQGARTLSGRREGLRSTLVVAEIALALVLLTGAGLMLKSFVRMRAVDPGFRAGNVLTLSVDLPRSVYRTAAQVQAFHGSVMAGLSQLPGVLSAGAVNSMPITGNLTMGDFHADGGKPLPPDSWADKLTVAPGYFRTAGIRMIAGRDFAERDNAAAGGVVIISRQVADAVWPGESAVGKRLTEEDDPKPRDWLTVVGVVDDVRQQGLRTDPDAALYHPYMQVTRPEWLSHMTFAVRTASDPQNLAPAMRRVLRDADKNQPAGSIATMQDVIAESTAEPLFQARLLAGFSLLALILSAIGIYGVLSYAVTERTQEIGIRMALGAGRAAVVGMVFRRTLTLAAAGIVLGAAGALAVTRVLAKFLFEVKPSDPATFVAVAVLLVVVAVCAGLMPARRATRVDPIVALRYE